MANQATVVLYCWIDGTRTQKQNPTPLRYCWVHGHISRPRAASWHKIDPFMRDTRTHGPQCSEPLVRMMGTVRGLTVPIIWRFQSCPSPPRASFRCLCISLNFLRQRSQKRSTLTPTPLGPSTYRPHPGLNSCIFSLAFASIHVTSDTRTKRKSTQSSQTAKLSRVTII